MAGDALATPITFSLTVAWKLVVGAAFIVLGLMHFSIANLVARVGIRHVTETIISRSDVQNKKFLLYLRVFAEDSSMGQPQQLSITGSMLRTILTYAFTEEQQLARALEPVGKLVTVGIPGELLPYAGAKRLYLPSKEWREPVRELIRQARVVIIMRLMQNPLMA